jgi:hypothetical protein
MLSAMSLVGAMVRSPSLSRAEVVVQAKEEEVKD